MAWNLIVLRAETFPVTYADDSSMHEQMVRAATARLREGHLPLTGWFPYLGEGSPHFLHYQSLPASLAGLIGLGIGPDPAFRWTLYLLLATWPVAVYAGARLLDLGRSAAAVAAVASPFLISVLGIGFEQKAYIWTGFGLWAQLWAMWTLPLAWGFSWRAIRGKGGWAPAIALVALTIALHFETGYLALLPLVLWPLMSGSPRLQSALRAVIVGAGALLAAAWVIVPLIAQRNWAATPEILRNSYFVNGYGAGRMLSWLVSGQLLDAHRIPVLTLLAAAGALVVLAERRGRWGAGPALLLMLFACLVLSFGRATFGSVVNVIPGSSDIFFRRFTSGVQLAALLLAGVGAAWCGRQLEPQLRRRLGRRRRSETPIVGLAAGLALVGVLAPGWLQLRSLTSLNAAWIRYQGQADRQSGPLVNRLADYIRRQGDGRVYAGLPSNWGPSFTVGVVPVFKYLESRDVEEVGYTLRTASLMTNPEYYFNEANPEDYRLFGVRYLLLPCTRRPVVPAVLVQASRPYCLWRAGPPAYVRLGTVMGSIDADRRTLGRAAVSLLNADTWPPDAYLHVHYGTAPRSFLLPVVSAPGPPGAVLAQSAQLAQGTATATVRARRPAVAVLSASFDVGWRATVDGRPNSTEMIAPALLGTRVPAGLHHVVFRYRGYAEYPWLFALSGLILIAAPAADLWARRRRAARGRGRPALPGSLS